MYFYNLTLLHLNLFVHECIKNIFNQFIFTLMLLIALSPIKVLKQKWNVPGSLKRLDNKSCSFVCKELFEVLELESIEPSVRLDIPWKNLILRSRSMLPTFLCGIIWLTKRLIAILILPNSSGLTTCLALPSYIPQNSPYVLTLPSLFIKSLQFKIPYLISLTFQSSVCKSLMAPFFHIQWFMHFPSFILKLCLHTSLQRPI